MLHHETWCYLPANNELLPTLLSLVPRTNTPDGLLSFPFPPLLMGAIALGILHAFSLSYATSQRLPYACTGKPAQIQIKEKQEMQKGATPSSQIPLFFGMEGIFNN